MKKLWILLLVSALCASTSLFAQEKNPKAMVQERLAFMKKNLTLSGQENQSFWKVYEEYLNAEMSYLNAKAAHESARLALVKAVQDYDWAMHGLISESSY